MYLGLSHLQIGSNAALLTRAMAVMLGRMWALSVVLDRLGLTLQPQRAPLCDMQLVQMQQINAQLRVT